MIVYGTRDGIDHHVEWGRRIHGELIGHGLYRADDPPEQRPVRILAMAQMGGIPLAFRPIIRTFVRGQTPNGLLALARLGESNERTLWRPSLDLHDVVSDRAGGVRLVTSDGRGRDMLRVVVEMIRRLA